MTTKEKKKQHYC